MAERLVLETDKIRATVDSATLKVEVLDKIAGYTWETAAEGPGDIGVRIGGVSHEYSFASDLERVVLHPSENKYRIVFPALNCFVGFALAPDRTDEIILTLGEAPGSGRAVPMAGSFPRNFITPVASDSYTVVPTGMGMLIPGNWSQRIRETYDSDCLEDNAVRLARYTEIFREGRPTFWWDVHDQVDMDVTKFHGGASMNMFGAKAGNSAFLCLVPRRFDWHLGVEHDPGQPTRVRHYWLPSMQQLNYDRVVHYRFCPGADYVDMAKMYRQWITAQGGFKSLAQKAEELPQLETCKGGVDTAIYFLHHDIRTKTFQVRQTFEQGIDLVRNFKERSGLTKAIVTVRGWQKLGHDHHYPSLLPPNSNCGGAPGFRKLAEAVRDMGYGFELAGDNYHDMAFDSPDFTEDALLRRPDGTYNRYNMWASGMTSILSLPWAFKFLRRNFELGKMDYPQTVGQLALAPFDYYWIGNWGGNGWEDYNRGCVMNREGYSQWVRRMLAYIREKGKVLEMEHCSEWCVPYLDRNKMWIPAMAMPNEDAAGDKQGVAIPLWALVFKDCSTTRMYGMSWEQEICYGGYPIISLPLRDDFESSGTLERLRIQTRLNKVIGFDEMLSHSFVDGNYEHERTEYASGVAVECNRRDRTFRIHGLTGLEEKMMAVPGTK